MFWKDDPFGLLLWVFREVFLGCTFVDISTGLYPCRFAYLRFTLLCGGLALLGIYPSMAMATKQKHYLEEQEPQL